MTPDMKIPLVRLVDDDQSFRTSQYMLLKLQGWDVEEFDSAEEFLEKERFERPGCIILDVRMMGMTGLDLQNILEKRGVQQFLPIIFLSGHGDISMAVHTVRHGAFNFFEKPVDPDKLFGAVRSCIQSSLEHMSEMTSRRHYNEIFASLTPREQDVVLRAAINMSNKEIANDLGIAESTVKMHRNHAFAKLDVNNVLDCYLKLKEMGIPNPFDKRSAE